MNYRAFVQEASIYAHYEQENERRCELQEYTNQAYDLAKAAFPEARVECVFSNIRITLPEGSREAQAMKVLRKFYGDRFFLYRDMDATGRRYDISYMQQDHMVLFRTVIKRFSHPGFLLIRDGECCIQFSDYDVVRALG